MGNNYPIFQKKMDRRRWRIFYSLSFLLILFLLVIYVIQVLDTTEQVYLAGSKEKRINQLLAENKSLEINFSEESSLEKIQQKINDLGLVRAEKIDYIRVLEHQIVKD